MSNSTKVALGIATLWPSVYVLIFIGVWFYMLLSVTLRPGGNEGAPFWMIAIFVVHGITMLWNIALLAIYIFNVFNNARVDNDRKVLWAVVLFFGNVIAMPIYWYLYIWREAKPLPAPAERSH